MTFPIFPVVMTDSRYRLLIRGMSRSVREALAHLIETGSIGPTDSRTIDALEKRDLICAEKGGYHPTELGQMVANYIANHKTAAPSKGWQGKSNI